MPPFTNARPGGTAQATATLCRAPLQPGSSCSNSSTGAKQSPRSATRASTSSDVNARATVLVWNSASSGLGTGASSRKNVPEGKAVTFKGKVRHFGARMVTSVEVV